MNRYRCTAVATALLLAAFAAVGCGLGPGEEVGAVELTVTRDFGAEPMVESSLQVRESDTVMRALESEVEIETRYGGGFVSAIDGVAEGRIGGDPHDWYYYVDGLWAPVGAAERRLEGGERIWWDYRDWSASSRVPAVVGSWPAPFSDGYEGREHPVAVLCRGGGSACAEVREALEAEGVALSDGSPPGAIRVLVGPWARLRDDPAAALLEAGPQQSGVYADFEPSGDGQRLVGLDEDGEAARRFGEGAGLVAATRRLEAPPTWLVTGTTLAGVSAAADLLEEDKLRNRFAVATEGGTEEPLPER